MIKQFDSAQAISSYIDSKIYGSFLVEDINFLGSYVKQLQPGDVYLEIGTQFGKSLASAVFQASEGIRFLTLDLEDFPTPDANKLSRQDFFISAALDQVCTFVKGNSVEFAEECPDESLAMVFIDAEHTYEAGKADILAWLPKLKSGGFMVFHDYSDPQFTLAGAIDELVKNSEQFTDFKVARNLGFGISSMAGAVKK